MTFGNFILGASNFANMCAEFVRESTETAFSIEKLEPASGIEPPTYGLRNRCSTTELRWHKLLICNDMQA